MAAPVFLAQLSKATRWAATSVRPALADTRPRSLATSPSSVARASATMPSATGRDTPTWRGSMSTWITRQLAGRPSTCRRHIEVADARADDEHHVGVAPQFVGRGTLRVEVERMLARHHGAAGHRRDHRAAKQFASSISAAFARARSTPVPAKITGRLAPARRSAAIESWIPRAAAATHAPFRAGRSARSCRRPSRRGRARDFEVTGPGRPATSHGRPCAPTPVSASTRRPGRSLHDRLEEVDLVLPWNVAGVDG